MSGANNMKIPIGPQHPALKEPQSFCITLNGEKIIEMEARLGYNHRGIEKACEQRSYIQDIYLIERICGICSHAHTDNFVRAAEEIAGVEVTKRAQYIRMIIGELERVHSHLLWLGVAGHEIGFDTLLMYSWRDREAVMDLLAHLTGNRVNYGIHTLGGVRRDISSEQAQLILKTIDLLEERTKYYIEVASVETTVIERLSRSGFLSLDDVKRLGTLGPTARASGLDFDVRRDDPYECYADIAFDVITDTHCDVYGRTLVRVGELMQSYRIIRQLAANLPDGALTVKFPRRVPAGEAVSRYEAPRGEDVHYVKANGTDKPERVRVRAPTMVNVQCVPKMLENNYLADVPIVLAAIDPCFSCTDRMIEIREAPDAGGSILSWGQLREYGIQWHKQRGLDLAKVRLEKKTLISCGV